MNTVFLIVICQYSILGVFEMVYAVIMSFFQELEASEELDTICPKAPKLEER